jgi:sugar/nucleoside kinase (ribokinase family)
VTDPGNAPTNDDPSTGDAPEVVTVGAATVDRQYGVTNLPEADGGAFAHEVQDTFGGVAANVATGCARLGRVAGIISRIGEDDVGDAVMADLRAGPLNLARVRRRDDTSTHCVVLRDGTGKRSIVTAGDSVKRLRLDDRDRGYLSDAQVVFVTAYAPDPVHRSLLAWTEDPAFPPVVFDLSGPLAELEGRGATPESVDRWVDAASLFVVGEVAADAYLGETGRVAADTLRDRGADRIAVTAGTDGAWLVPGGSETDESDRPAADVDDPSGRRALHVPAFDVTVADETGAGDAYVAGLIHAWLLGDRGTRAAGRFAAATAAHNCTETGARGNLPDEATVEAFLAERDD